jgi:phosphoglycerate kinase
MRSVSTIPLLHGIPVLVRAGLNVPVDQGVVTNDYRLRQALSTIEFLRGEGARVVLLGHLGDAGTESLMPVQKALENYVGKMALCPVTVGGVARQAVRDLAPGQVLLLENVRRNAGEKSNSRAFAQELAELADVFVMDAFDVCHREHASVVGVPEFLPAYAGLQVLREVAMLEGALSPTKPSLAVLGGAKFSTKEPVLQKLLQQYDQVFVGGALANDFLAVQGHALGLSLVSREPDVGALRAMLQRRLILPTDVVVARPGEKTGRVVSVSSVPPDMAIRDIGPESVAALETLVGGARTVLWNGPLGLYEEGFTDATHHLASTIARAHAHAVLGGGDTVAAVEALDLSDQFTFVSTGGGAMLDYLAKGMLPGLQALR